VLCYAIAAMATPTIGIEQAKLLVIAMLPGYLHKNQLLRQTVTIDHR